VQGTATISVAAQAIRAFAHPLTGAATDYDPLLDLVGDARFVLLGEASHGTQEFYRERATITQLLIRRKDFTAVAVEADWPDACRVNRYARGLDDDASPEAALDGFRRFPTWMWRNTVVRDFAGWLRRHNAAAGSYAQQVGFYGLDLYSLYGSIDAVIRYLETVDPAAAQQARARYACFEHFHEDTQAYGYAANFGMSKSCEDAVVSQLQELQQRAAVYAHRDGRVAADEYFHAEQNARLARDAEQYYRSMFGGRGSSWNLRDRHMAQTLEALVEHVAGQGRPAKVVVWAHNSHLGDARATAMGEGGELNVGQLVRERYGRDAVLVGFSTDHGWVTAASDWDRPAERKRVRPALDGSYEQLFHEAAADGGAPNFLLRLRDAGEAAALRAPRLERAIGVVYLPQTERWSHYFEARLPEQFDAVLHFDETNAVEPLERSQSWESGEAPETYPSAL
jgi:erythromycin esterase-like protein